MAPDHNVELLLDFIKKLCCPKEKAQKQVCVDLHIDNGCLYSPEKACYTIKDGVPDLRPYPSKFAAENYADIHSLFDIDRKVDVERFSQLYALSQELVANKIVLLTGAGVGTELACLIRYKPALIVAIDYSNHIRVIKDKYKYEHKILFLQADIHNLPFKSEVFDLTFNSGVMQHLRSPELGFRQMVLSTKRGGMVSIGSLYLDNLKNRKVSIARIERRYHKKPYEKMRELFEKTIWRRRLMSSFKLARLDYFMTNSLYLPMYSTNPADALCAVMDFYYSEYRHVFEEDEIYQWFHESGCADVIKKERHFIGRRI